MDLTLYLGKAGFIKIWQTWPELQTKVVPYDPDMHLLLNYVRLDVTKHAQKESVERNSSSSPFPCGILHPVFQLLIEAEGP